MKQEKPSEIRSLEAYLGRQFLKREIRLESPVYVGVYCHRPEGYTENGEPFGRRSFWFDTEGDSNLNFLAILYTKIQEFLEHNSGGVLGSSFYKTKNGSLIRQKDRETIKYEFLGTEIDTGFNIVKDRVNEQAVDTIEIFNPDEEKLNQTYEEVKREISRLEVIAKEKVNELKAKYEKIGMIYGS